MTKHAVCLNTNHMIRLYQELINSEYFVDKSSIIETINRRIKTSTKYICVTKPRRFGKTSVLNMLGAYYGKAYGSKALFDDLNISKSPDYAVHLNQYNIIYLCLNNLPEDGNCFDNYINLIKETLYDDLIEAYPKLKDRKFRKLSDLLAATNDEFIFIIDEWDYIFSHELYLEHQGDFLEFLRDLLKDRPYVALAYMTGVLPIKQYSTGSALNMFREYTMLHDPAFERYFGFTEAEVTELCAKQHRLTLNEINEWYNGYQTKEGGRIYNPWSVVCALEDGVCQSYWGRTGKIDEVLSFLKYNMGEVREDVVKMINHMPVRLEIQKEYTAGQGKSIAKKEIYAAMVIYGLLSYSDSEIRIPNKELMIEFESALKYNDENSLSCVVTLAYLSARNKYKIEREEKSGKGYADFLFYPRRKNPPGIIIELKADSSPEVAIRQIKEKEYFEKLKKENIGSVLAVGISYDTEKKRTQMYH